MTSREAITFIHDCGATVALATLRDGIRMPLILGDGLAPHAWELAKDIFILHHDGIRALLTEWDGLAEGTPAMADRLSCLQNWTRSVLAELHWLVERSES